jgi:hypothetical protein
LKGWKVALKDNLTGLAILGVEEVNLNRSGRLGNSLNGERKKKKDKEGNRKVSQRGSLSNHLIINNYFMPCKLRDKSQ